MRRRTARIVAALALASSVAGPACTRGAPEPSPSPSGSAVSSATPPPPEPGLTAEIQAIDVPLVRYAAAGAVESAGARLFVWGGATGPSDAGAGSEGADPKLLEVVSLRDLKHDTTRIGGSAPVSVFVPAMAHDPYSSALYVFGGWAKGKTAPSDALHRIDTAGDRFVGRAVPRSNPWPGPRNGASMVADTVGNTLLLFAGDAGPGAESFTPLDDLWRFDLERGRWQRVDAAGDRPPARWHAAMAIDESGRSAYLFGGAGRAPDPYDAHLYELGLATLTWSLVRATGDLPPSLQGASLTFDPEHRALVLVGGLRHLPPGPAVASEIWILDLERKRWTKVDGGPQLARRDHVAGYDTATRAHYVLGGRVSQTLGDFYENGEPVAKGIKIRLKRR